MAESLQCSEADRRTVNQGHHGGIATVVEHLLQTHLQRTELAAVRVSIDYQRSSLRINDGYQRRFVFPHHDHDEISSRCKRTDRSREECLTGWSLPGRQWGTRHEGLVPTHARGL